MASVRFDYEGQTYNANVTDDFLSLPEDEQRKRLELSIKPKEAPAKGGGFMGALSKLETPRRMVLGGLKETALGGDIYEAIGGIDTTPKEGFLTGAKRGLFSEENIRTQDFMDPSLPGWYRGLWGFVGDVATDPLTYVGGALGKTIYHAGKAGVGAIRSHTPPQVARWLQTVKDHDRTRDVARGLNIPMGEERKIKSLAKFSARERERVEKQLAKDLPEMKNWMDGKIKSSGKSEEEVHSAFRSWLDRPQLHDDSKGIITGWTKADDLKLKKQTEAILGKDGLLYANEWSRKMQKFLREEQAAGIFVRGLTMRNYFPRFDTPMGRELLEKTKDVGDPSVFLGKETFRTGRTTDPLESIDDINLRKNAEKVELLGGTAAKNPADIPYEQRFFHTDPNVAIGLRYADHATSMQKKWFIDTVTDSGQAFKVSSLDKGLPPFLGVGRWMRRSRQDPAIVEQRTIGANGEEIWKPIDQDMRDWVSVKGVDEYRREELLKAAENAGDDAYSQAVSQGQSASIANSLAGKAKSNFMKNAEKSQDVFKAPKHIAKQIEQQMELMGASSASNKELQKFFKFYDRIQNPWKAWTLAVRPAYHMRNAVGNIFNAYIVTGLGSNIPKAVETFGDAAKLQYYARFEGRDALRQGVYDRLTDGGKSVRAEGLKSLPKIDDKTWVADNFADTGYSMERVSNEALDRGINAGHYRKDVVRDEIENMEYQLGRGKYQKWSKRMGQDNPAIRFGFAVGGTIEGNARYAIFLNTLNKIKNGEDLAWVAPDGKKVKLSEFGKGDDVYWTTQMQELPDGQFSQVRRIMPKDDAAFDIASNQVKEALFDYSDLSHFERNWMKRVMPFYTWTRKNFPVQIKHLVLNPQRAEKLHLAKEQFEYDSGEIDLSEIGAFWGKRVPVFIGKENAGVIKAFTMLNTIPLVELQRFAHPKALVTEMISPIPKEIFEQLANYDTFREKPIVEFPEEGFLGESKDLLGVELPARLWKLAQLMVPLIEINRANPAGVFGEKTLDPETGEQYITRGWGGWGSYRESNPTDLSEVARWMRFFTGARTYDVDLEKQSYFENKNFSKDLASLKAKLKWAVAKGENRRAEQIIRTIEAYERQKFAEEQ